MQSHDAEYRESGEGWARTPEPAAMTVPLSDTRLPTYCGSSHWSLPVRCALPTGHGPDYHAGWTGTSGAPGRVYVRYWAETGVTEQLIAGVWQPTGIPGPRPEELLAEVDRLRAELEERRVELRDRRTEDLNLRGMLAPDGMPRRVPMELGSSLVPAVERLLLELDRFRDGHQRLFALASDGQHWDGQRLVSEALLSQRDIRRALHWPAPVAPDGPCKCKATSDGVPVHPTTETTAKEG